jgi:hypothetical protein
MNYEQRKNIFEAVALVTIVASLIFLGLEIRQSNVQARAAAYQAIGIATAAAYDSEAHDRQFTMLRQKAADDMDASDWAQLAAKMTVFARLGETVLLQVEQGLLPPDALDRLGFIGWKRIFEDRKIACIWPLIRPEVSSSFREFVEGEQNVDEIDCSSFDIPQ